MPGDDPDRKHTMRSAWENFNRIYECLRSGEVHVNGSVARGRNISKYFRGCNVVPAGVVHHIQVGNRSAVYRESHVTAVLLKPRRLREQEMNLVSSRRNGKIAMKNAAPSAGEKLRILRALDGVTGNGE